MEKQFVGQFGNNCLLHFNIVHPVSSGNSLLSQSNLTAATVLLPKISIRRWLVSTADSRIRLSVSTPWTVMSLVKNN
jgi:hypothetical protein